MAYISRALQSALRTYLRYFPVVGITGPRQSGKSTMLENALGRGYRYVSFDDPEVRAGFEMDPVGFMTTYDDRVVFDEVQYVPELFEYVKVAVDRDRSRYGKFIITGSAQFAMMKHVSESLAGRIGLLSLLPFQYSEIPHARRKQAVYRGGYPELVARGFRADRQWYAAYIDTYMTRDLRSVTEIGDLRDFRRCIEMLAARTSQLLNMTEFSKDLGVSVPTIKRWISVLEASYLVFLLPPYYGNLGKRIIKSPKIYFYDTGLVSYLTGIRNEELFEKGPMKGAIFENYVVAETVKRELHTDRKRSAHFYRDSNGNEVDLILVDGQQRELIEIKSTRTYDPSAATNINKLRKDGDKCRVVYRGKTLDSGRVLKIQNYSEYLLE